MAELWSFDQAPSAAMRLDPSTCGGKCADSQVDNSGLSWFPNVVKEQEYGSVCVCAHTYAPHTHVYMYVYLLIYLDADIDVDVDIDTETGIEID